MSEIAAFDQVGFAYPDGTRALIGIDLAIREGERVAIVGRNGSGKSTLIRHLNGLLRPTEGRVRVAGRDIAGVHVATLARTVGLAFQDPDRQIFAGTVAAEVAFGARNLGRRGADLERAVEAALAAVGIEAEAATNPYDLGRSRRKLLTLASVLAMDTPVVVLDEPTTGQDARGAALVGRIVAELAAKGRTVIAVSHDLRLVAESFERVVVLGAGRVTLDAPPEVAFAAEHAEALAATSLEAPLSARLGERLGLGTTPTDAILLDRLAAAAGASREPDGTPGP